MVMSEQAFYIVSHVVGASHVRLQKTGMKMSMRSSRAQAWKLGSWEIGIVRVLSLGANTF